MRVLSGIRSRTSDDDDMFDTRPESLDDTSVLSPEGLGETLIHQVGDPVERHAETNACKGVRGSGTCGGVAKLERACGGCLGTRRQ